MCCSHASADWDWDFSGFATLGAGKTNRDSFEYIKYDGDWSFDSDTMLGLQIVVHPMDRISFTGQIVAHAFNSDPDISSFEPQLEWAFSSIDLYDYGRLRVGRLRTPHQYFSESLEVGYSYVWVRPPVDVYAFAFEPFTHFDGVDYSYNFYMDNSDIELKALFGTTQGDYLVSSVDIKKLWGVSATARWDDIAIRYSFIDHKLSIYSQSFEPLIDALILTSQQLPFENGLDRVADRLVIDNGHMPYHNLSVDWRVGKWSFIAEGVRSQPPKQGIQSYIRHWYFSASRQIGKFTPYFVYGDFDAKLKDQMFKDAENAFNAISIFSGGLTPELQSLQTQTNLAMEGYSNSQRSYSLGLRYELHPKIALKGEVQYLETEKDSIGQFIPKSATTSVEELNDAMIVTVVVDVIF